MSKPTRVAIRNVALALGGVVAVAVLVVMVRPGAETEAADVSCGDMVSVFVSAYYDAHGEAPGSDQVDRFRGETPECGEEYARARRDEQERERRNQEAEAAAGAAGVIITCEDMVSGFVSIYTHEYGYEPSQAELTEYKRVTRECGRSR